MQKANDIIMRSKKEWGQTGIDDDEIRMVDDR
jgi:hypothetical protein